MWWRIQMNRLIHRVIQEPSWSPRTRTKMLLLLSSLRSLKGFRSSVPGIGVRDQYIFSFISQIPIKWISLYYKNLYFLNEDTSLSFCKEDIVCLHSGIFSAKKKSLYTYIKTKNILISIWTVFCITYITYILYELILHMWYIICIIYNLLIIYIYFILTVYIMVVV